jgi:hypothetical protein
MREAHVVGSRVPSRGAVAILSLTARRRVFGGGGCWGVGAGNRVCQRLRHTAWGAIGEPWGWKHACLW